MILLLCTLVVADCLFFFFGVVSVDQMICKTVRVGLVDRMPLTQLILAFLSVCLFIHQGVFELLPQRQRLPLHNFLLYCIAAELQRHRATRFAKLRTNTLVLWVCGQK